MGRKSSYSKRIATKICAALYDGEVLSEICKRKGMVSERTVRRWLASGDYPDLCHAYARADIARSYIWAEEAISIPDSLVGTGASNEEIQLAKLRVDTRKWMLSKIRPEKYGDRIEVEGGEELAPTEINLHFESRPIRHAEPSDTKKIA